MLISWLAGFLTILSPCVLPILPLLLGGAMQSNRTAPIYMALGLCISFSLFGVLFASSTEFISLAPEDIKLLSSILLFFVGLTMLFPRITFFKSALNRLADRANILGSNLDYESPLSNLLLGALLGALWAPCAGPSLGVAMALALKGESILQSFLHFFAFGLGASSGLLAISLVLRSSFKSLVMGLQNNSQKIKGIFGIILCAFSILIMAGLDKPLEVILTQYTPEFILNISTKY